MIPAYQQGIAHPGPDCDQLLLQQSLLDESLFLGQRPLVFPVLQLQPGHLQSTVDTVLHPQVEVRWGEELRWSEVSDLKMISVDYWWEEPLVPTLRRQLTLSICSWASSTDKACSTLSQPHNLVSTIWGEGSRGEAEHQAIMLKWLGSKSWSLVFPVLTSASLSKGLIGGVSLGLGGWNVLKLELVFQRTLKFY